MKVDSHTVAMNAQYYNLKFEQTEIEVSSKEKDFNSDETKELQKIEADKASQDRAHNELTKELSKGVLQNIFNEKKRLTGDRVEISTTYAETQGLNFQIAATVNADGRKHEISIDVSLSRSFLQHTSISVGLPKNLSDPLVLSLNGRMPAVSDNTFAFDIDSDGKKDQISTLAQGSAFLALDKNDNGLIDDGSELFGAKSGNGFADLAKYDDDNNGWIDENDAIFSKLRVWEKTGEKDSLVALGEVGIGAIFLGNMDTPFSMKSGTNELNAELRKSGFFMFESGQAGLISHIDFAITDDAKSKIDILEDMTKKASSLKLDTIYANQKDEKTEDKGESQITKLQSKISKLEAKLANAPQEKRAPIQAQIAVLMGKMMTLI